MARSKGTPKSILIATRVTPRINQAIQQMAYREGLYVSEWIRKIVTNELLKNNMLPKTIFTPNRAEQIVNDEI